MKCIAIIQARMGSSRLPGKILMPLGDSDVLSYVVERCRKIIGVDEVIVATSNLVQDNAVAQWCQQKNVAYYRGSETDVLDRYVQCAKMYQPDYVMRVTADCPFVDYVMASEMVATMAQQPNDICILEGELPRGLAVEMIAYDALCKIDAIGKEERHREHVTYYAYEFKEQFTQTHYKAPQNIQAHGLRITLDTAEDYELIQQVAKHFANPFVTSADVVAYLQATPEVATINAHIEQKPVL